MGLLKPRVLLVADEPGWGFDANLRDLAAYLGDEFAFGFWYCARQGPPLSLAGYDGAYVTYRWQLGEDFPYRRSVGSLRSTVWDGARSTPTAAELAAVARWGGFHTVTRGSYEQLCAALRAQSAETNRIAYLTNPVDTRRFRETTPVRDRIVASWSGNALHSSPSGVRVKGFAEIIVPACRRAGVPLVAAEYHTSRLPLAEMPAFYQHGNVTLCASLYEGAANAVLEAMACGHAVVATDVGNHREIVESEREHFGDVGVLLVGRSVEAFAAALSALTPDRVAAMGAINRREIAERWSWEVWRDRYAALLRAVLGGA